MLPTELLRPGPAIFYSFWRLFAKTRRDFRKLQSEASVLNYGWIFPFHCMVLVISLCYSIISPLVLLPALFYFGFAWIVHKNQIVYVYIKQSENNGQFWVNAYNRVIFGVLIFQFLTTGILSSKKAPYAAVWCAVLLPITWLFHRYCKNSFKILDKIPAIDSLKDDVDIQHESRRSPENHYLHQIDDYRPPALSRPLSKPMPPMYIAHLLEEQDPYFEHDECENGPS